MEIAILIILIVVLVLVVVLLTKGINESNIIERLGKIETTTIKELEEFKSDINRNLNEDFDKLNEKMENKLRLINDQVNERLDQNFEKTNKTFNSVIERLSKIDEAQKKIDTLSNDIVSLQNVLTDKKARGTFGEVNLKHIMASVFGNNETLYKMQYKFNNETMADCVLFAPEPLGVLAIDSKFPLEHYQTMVDKKNSEIVRLNAEKMFKQDVKKHIDDISSKYIIPNVTSDQAIMFLPAEAIFAEINAYHTELLEYAYKKRIWLTSPTTLISTLTTIQVILKNIERDKNTNIIRRELNLLGEDFKRYKDRWDKLYRSIETVSKDVKDIHTTTNKITNRFDSINHVDFKEEKIEYENDEFDN